MHQVLELVGKDALVQVRPGYVRANAIFPIVRVDVHDVLVVLGALAGREVASDVRGLIAVIVRLVADVEDQDPGLLALVAARKRLAVNLCNGGIDIVVELAQEVNKLVVGDHVLGPPAAVRVREGVVRAVEAVVGGLLDEDDTPRTVQHDHEGLVVVDSQAIVGDGNGELITDGGRITDRRGVGGRSRADLSGQLADGDFILAQHLNGEIHRLWPRAGHLGGWRHRWRAVGGGRSGAHQHACQQGNDAQYCQNLALHGSFLQILCMLILVK